MLASNILQVIENGMITSHMLELFKHQPLLPWYLQSHMRRPHGHEIDCSMMILPCTTCTAYSILLILFIVDYSIVLLIQGGNLANTSTYQGLVNTAFGKIGFLVLTAMQFLYPFIGKSKLWYVTKWFYMIQTGTLSF